MSRKVQAFFSDEFAPRTEHGGEIRERRRKLHRPIDPSRPLHVVMRSTHARGALSFLHPSRKRRVKHEAEAVARRFGIRIYQYANAGNHLHFVLRGTSRSALQGFFRALPGRIAQLVTGARKGKPFKPGRFWEKLIYSRVLEWGRAFEAAKQYVLQNELEAEGVIPYQPRKNGKPQSWPAGKRTSQP